MLGSKAETGRYYSTGVPQTPQLRNFIFADDLECINQSSTVHVKEGKLVTLGESGDSALTESRSPY